MRTVALVSTDATIDFFCFPRFDSPSVFVSLLDDAQGGQFSIRPRATGAHTRQMYLSDTNVLITRFTSPEGMAEVIDYMPISPRGPQSALVRRLRCVSGTLAFDVRCAPRFDYARVGAHAQLDDAGTTALFRIDGEQGPLRLRSTVPLSTEGGDAMAQVQLQAGDEAGFVFECVNECPSEGELAPFIERSLIETMDFWRRWSEQSQYRGRWRETVQRSALTLKLLSSFDHGAIVGAATFGLPEHPGGVRNWDYRYCWLRDAAFSVYGLMRLGYTEEAGHFIAWTQDRAREHEAGSTPQVMYAVDGRRVGEEIELTHLRGYRDSRPVRVGNGAAGQLQLDVLGELTDAVYLADKHGAPLSVDAWRGLSGRVEWLCEHWDQPEEGIWEMRGERRDLLSGRLLCWVALDRAIRMSRRFARPAPLTRWLEVRDTIALQILEQFWSPGKQAFVQYRGGEALDAVALLMPLLKFISPTDPRWLSTLDAIGRELGQDVLIRRYTTVGDAAHRNVDGMPGEEGTFTPCSFWYVECLALAGRVEEARLRYERLLTYANHVGLYAEELGANGEQLGNFPLAWSHLSLISAAYALNRALEDGHLQAAATSTPEGHPWPPSR